MRKILTLVFIAALRLPALHAQGATFDPASNPLHPSPGGIRLDNVSAFLSYYSVAPQGLFGSPGGSQINGETGVGGSATVAYGTSGERSGFSIVYTPTYVARLRYANSNSVNHALNLSWRHKLAPRWTMNWNASGVMTSASDALFAPMTLSNVTAISGSIADLAAALEAGRLTNSQAAAVLTGSPVLESPAGLLLFGNRLLNASAGAGLSYAQSARLTFRIAFTANRLQALRDPNSPAGYQYGYQIAHSTMGSVNAGFGYSLSPRTQLSADFSTNRAVSNLQDAYTTMAMMAVERTLGTRWFVQLRGGSGFIHALRETRTLPAGPQYQVGGNIGYKTRSHTFLGSVERSISDTYGFGSSYSVSATGAWNWRRPGSAWSLATSFGQQRLAGISFEAINTWRGSAGLVRSLGAHTNISTQYAYLSNLRVLGALNGGQQAQHVIQVAVTWIPDRRSMQ